MKNNLSVVICTHNRSSSLISTLISLYSDSYSETSEVEVVVIANNCTDNTIDKLKIFKSNNSQSLLNLKWFEEPKPGKSNALNTAIKNTTSEVLCFIDDDQTVETCFLNNVVNGLISFPDNQIYCGRIKPAWDGSEPTWVHIKGKHSIPIRPYPEFDLGENTKILSKDDKLPSGGNIIIKRKVFDHIGNFSTDLGPTGHNMLGGEDHDFLSRALKENYTIRYLPDVKQLHAIDKERTKTFYILKKSYFRSRSSYLVKKIDINNPFQLFMLKKILYFSAFSIFSTTPEQRFYYLVRLFASLGELSGALHNLIHQK